MKLESVTLISIGLSGSIDSIHGMAIWELKLRLGWLRAETVPANTCTSNFTQACYVSGSCAQLLSSLIPKWLRRVGYACWQIGPHGLNPFESYKVCQMPQATLVLLQKLSYHPQKIILILQVAQIVRGCLTRFLTVKITAECRQLGVETTNAHWLKMAARLEKVDNL